MAGISTTQLLLQTRQPGEKAVAKVKEKIEDFPTYGCWRLALLLGMNKKVVQRILQLKWWQVKNAIKASSPGQSDALKNCVA